MSKFKEEQWICFKTNSREEFIAYNTLMSKGFNVLMPYYLKTVSHARRKIQVKYPIFPLYGFLKFDGEASSLYKIKYSRGVKYYLKYLDGYPQILPKNVIKAIQALKKEDGSFRLNPNRFSFGDEVKIIEGVFTGIKAIFNNHIDEWRSSLLISLIGRINQIEINPQMIEKI